MSKKVINPLWIHGTCDRIMVTLQKWIMKYHDGKISATGRYMTKPGEMGPEIKEIDRPTRYATEVAWRQDDLDYLIKILEKMVPEWPVTRDLRSSFPRWKNGKLLPGGMRIITMDMYFSNLVEIYQLLEAIRDGKVKETKSDLAAIDLSKIV